MSDDRNTEFAKIRMQVKEIGNNLNEMTSLM